MLEDDYPEGRNERGEADRPAIRVAYIVYTPEGEGGVLSKPCVTDYLSAVEGTEIASMGMKFWDVKDELTRDRYDVFYFPGGGKSRIHAEALGREGQDRIREFVRNGGGYLGICSGAYAAACGPKPYNLGLANAKVVSSWTFSGKVDIRMEAGGGAIFTSPEYAPKTVRKIVHANGPLLDVYDRSRPGYVTIATLAGDEVTQCKQHIPLKGYPSMLYDAYGKGRVVVCSSHPELADEATGNGAMLPERIRWLARRKPADM